VKVLLLNPPGDRLYLRDYYCSHASKARYYWHPYDLLVQSGFLAPEFEVQALDAMVTRMPYDKAAKDLQRRQFDALFFLTGAVSWRKDFAFVEQVVKGRDVRVVATGDFLLTQGPKVMEEFPFLDAVLLDLTSVAVVEYLRGDLDGDPRTNLHYRHNGKLIIGERKLESRKFTLPLPRYEIFPYRKYRIPHGKGKVFASILTDYGCPYQCSFCIGGKLGYKTRDLDNVMEELQYFYGLGIRELWVKDLTFGCSCRHGMEFCQALIDSGMKFDWVALSRVDVMDDEILTVMARAGCHTLQLGVESADEEILKSISKGISKQRIVEVFRCCRKVGIRTLAHFIIGLPGETETTALETIEFAKQLEPDYASFNVATPRIGTDLRAQALAKGYTSEDLDVLDNSLSWPVMITERLSSERLWALRNKAIREFHLRPRYIFRLLRNFRSFREVYYAFREGLALLKTTEK